MYATSIKDKRIHVSPKKRQCFSRSKGQSGLRLLFERGVFIFVRAALEIALFSGQALSFSARALSTLRARKVLFIDSMAYFSSIPTALSHILPFLRENKVREARHSSARPFRTVEQSSRQRKQVSNRPLRTDTCSSHQGTHVQSFKKNMYIHVPFLSLPFYM